MQYAKAAWCLVCVKSARFWDFDWPYKIDMITLHVNVVITHPTNHALYFAIAATDELENIGIKKSSWPNALWKRGEGEGRTTSVKADYFILGRASHSRHTTHSVHWCLRIAMKQEQKHRRYVAGDDFLSLAHALYFTLTRKNSIANINTFVLWVMGVWLCLVHEIWEIGYCSIFVFI